MPFVTASNAEETCNLSNICCIWLETVLSLIYISTAITESFCYTADINTL